MPNNNTAMRCDNCRKINFDVLRVKRVQQQPSIADLKSSAELGGCDLCKLSYAALVKWYGTEEIDSWCRRKNSSGATEHDLSVCLERAVVVDDESEDKPSHLECGQVWISVGIKSSQPVNNAVMLEVCTDPEAPPAKYVSGRLPSQTPGDALSMSRVKRWLDDCDQNHTKCAHLSEDNPLPKRILDIEGSKPIVRETNGLSGRYVALSYCWGTSGKNLLLTQKKERDTDYPGKRSNFERFVSDGIETDELVKTIEHAIVLCQSLGIKYLWVDALCIIQNEPGETDFKTEALRMHEYYGNAYFTLTAGSAKDCTEGFLNQRAPVAAPCEIDYARTTTPHGSDDRDMTGTVTLSIELVMEHDPITKRAWTLQESLLSQRELIFGLDQIHFRCQQRVEHEAGYGRGVKDDENAIIGVTGSRVLQSMASFDNSAKKNIESIRGVWLSAIDRYSYRDMTRPKDRFTAIASFAQLVQKHLQSPYVYGLWMKCMPYDLLWIAPNPELSTRDPDRAPSWSWASIDGQVYSRLDRQNSMIYPVDQSFELVSLGNVSTALDPLATDRESFAALSAAFGLTLRASVRRVWIMPPDPRYLMRFPIGFKPPGSNEVRCIGRAIIDSRDDLRLQGCQVDALLLLRSKGILVTRVDGGGCGGKAYRRIGIFNLNANRGKVFEERHRRVVVLI